jgi:transketolase
MAIAEKTLGAQFNRAGHTIVDHHTWVFLGDGCLMEGVSHEACSLAGTQGLGKLIAIYDDNGISIDGEVEGWFTDDTPKRFEAYGWQVIPEVDGHDSAAIEAAFTAAQAETTRPTLICCKTVIGQGSPNKAGTESCHGAPLGEDEIALTRETLGWPHAAFEVPEAIYEAWDNRAKGANLEAVWQVGFDAYRAEFPELADDFLRRLRGELPANFVENADKYVEDRILAGADVASRKASQQALNAFGPQLPELLGGSADLAGSNLTLWQGAQGISAQSAAGNYLYYGVREFAMAAIMNGIALHGGFIPYGATFLIFMEYARNALRMSALMGQRVLYVFTHDSIGLGEDGPTHQPVEQLTALRATPNLHTWRPCDAVESAIAWKQGLLRVAGPTAMIFSRQTLPAQITHVDQALLAHRGGYILVPEQGNLDAIIIATGSEVALAVEAAERLTAAGKGIRVVSMPCAEVFEAQEAGYREAVLPSDVLARVAVEAAHTDFWYKYVGLDGRVVGMSSFGESAPAGDLFHHFGITTDNVVGAVEDVILD